jgi:hypothetical protein
MNMMPGEVDTATCDPLAIAVTYETASVEAPTFGAGFTADGADYEVRRRRRRPAQWCHALGRLHRLERQVGSPGRPDQEWEWTLALTFDTDR